MQFNFRRKPRDWEYLFWTTWSVYLQLIAVKYELFKSIFTLNMGLLQVLHFFLVMLGVMIPLHTDKKKKKIPLHVLFCSCVIEMLMAYWHCSATMLLKSYGLLPLPLSIQELFLKLSRMASIAADMFVGRERFATLLLMRLTETIILWLSDDQSFWDDIEEGPRPLGPLGLQQVYA